MFSNDTKLMNFLLAALTVLRSGLRNLFTWFVIIYNDCLEWLDEIIKGIKVLENGYM